MLIKTEAIVLHAFKLGEAKMVVDLFTREQGRLSFVVSLPKTAKGRLKKQYFQPLMLLQVECDVRQGAQLQKLKDVSLLTPLPSLLTEPTKLCISLFVAEFLYHALKGEQRNVPLFDYVRNSVEWLDGRDDHIANFHLVFLMRLSRFLGFYPNLELRGEEIEVSGERPVYFDLRAATFCAEPPLHRDFLQPQEAGRLRLMMRMDYPSMHLFQLSHHDRQRLLDIALHYYRLHLPDFPELKSLDVLKELYRE
jgi:DNA repair protein RecO (recombination protein O)